MTRRWPGPWMCPFPPLVYFMLGFICGAFFMLGIVIVVTEVAL